MKVEGGEQLRALAVELKEADKALLLAMRRNLRGVAKTAGAAVQAEERRVLPKAGGLNEWIAGTPVGVRIATGSRTAGVRIVQSKKGRRKPHDLLDANTTGLIRHPNRGGPRFSQERRDRSGGWSDTTIPTGWWERPLLARAPAAEVAMRAVLNETARAAGFH